MMVAVGRLSFCIVNCELSCIESGAPEAAKAGEEHGHQHGQCGEDDPMQEAQPGRGCKDSKKWPNVRQLQQRNHTQVASDVGHHGVAAREDQEVG